MKFVACLLLLVSALTGIDAQCPDVCACFSLTDTVDCTPRPAVTGVDFQFTSIPDGGPITTRVLIMTGNAISSLPPGNLSAYPLLETLILNDNLLTDIPTLDIPQLTNLTLDGNPFVSLQSRAFSNLTSLQHLYIRRTTLSTINADTFEGLTTLANLFIDDNQFTSLPADFLSFIPQLELLSLTNTPLQTLPDGFLSPLDPAMAQVDLVDNPWSCDCFLQWLKEYLDVNNVLVNDADTVCQWPLAHLNQPISVVDSSDFTCYSSEITRSPQNATLLSNVTLAIACRTDGAPFPTVTWMKDGEIFNYTSRVHLQDTFSGSLFFESLELSDSGVYGCNAENINGTDVSGLGEIVILEHTCFDNLVSSDHETDEDCGGEFCVPCNISQRCLLDRDCEGELICLFSHQLPSQLHYISSSNPIAFTCANSTVPPTLLEAILQTELPADIFSANVSGLQNETDLTASMHSLLATQLDVSMATISNVRVSTVEKALRPLVQVWFELPKTRVGELTRSRVVEQVDQGQLRATVKIDGDGASYKIRMNL